MDEEKESNVIEFPRDSMVKSCDECGCIEWYMTDQSRMECVDCGASPANTVWALIMTEIEH